MADFQGVDFLRLDELLSDEEKLARESVREFVTKEFLPRIQEHVARTAPSPWSWWRPWPSSASSARTSTAGAAPA